MKSTRLTWMVIAAAAIFVMASSNPQCAKTETSPLTPTLSPLVGEGNPCIDRCNAEASGRRRTEQIRHKAALDLCNGDPECKQAESEVHTRLQNEINEDMQTCKKVCQHEQGTGTGGQ